MVFRSKTHLRYFFGYRLECVCAESILFKKLITIYVKFRQVLKTWVKKSQIQVLGPHVTGNKVLSFKFLGLFSLK